MCHIHHISLTEVTPLTQPVSFFPPHTLSSVFCHQLSLFLTHSFLGFHTSWLLLQLLQFTNFISFFSSYLNEFPLNQPEFWLRGTYLMHLNLSSSVVLKRHCKSSATCLLPVLSWNVWGHMIDSIDLLDYSIIWKNRTSSANGSFQWILVYELQKVSRVLKCTFLHKYFWFQIRWIHIQRLSFSSNAKDQIFFPTEFTRVLSVFIKLRPAPLQIVLKTDMNSDRLLKKMNDFPFFQVLKKKKKNNQFDDMNRMTEV